MTETTHATEPNARVLTSLLAALTALTSLSIDMSLPTMPQLQQTFHAGVSSVQLTLSVFLLGFALGQLVCGPISDRKGRRPVLLAGLGLFALAGLACALSTSLPMLVACRLLQGVGASVGPVVARAVVRDYYDARRGAVVLSQMTQVMIVAPLVAPTLGGYLLVHVGWPSIFLTLGGGGVLLLLACWRYLPETARDRMEPAGGERVGALAGLRALVANRASARHVLTVCFVYAGMFAYIGGSPFVLMDVFGVAEQNFGYYFAVTAAGLFVSATLNRWLLKRHMSPLFLLGRGVLVVFAAGLCMITAVWFGVGGLIGVMAPMTAYMFGQGLVMPNATAAAMEPHGRSAGVVSSVMGFLQTGAAALSGYLVGLFYDHTPLSLAVTVAAFASLTLLASGPTVLRGSRTDETGTDAAHAREV